MYNVFFPSTQIKITQNLSCEKFVKLLKNLDQGFLAITLSFRNFSASQHAFCAFISFIRSHSLNNSDFSNVAQFGISGVKLGTPLRALTPTRYLVSVLWFLFGIFWIIMNACKKLEAIMSGANGVFSSWYMIVTMSLPM